MRGPKLSFRPDPCEGESWPGYLLRLSNANGLRGLRAIATSLQMTEERLLRADINKIGKLLNLSDVSAHSSDGSAYRGYVNMRTRLCPECLQNDEVPFIRAAWDSPLKMHCEFHRKLLVDTCPVCCRELGYRRSWLNVCQCGTLLESWRTFTSEAWLRDLYEVVQTKPTIDLPRPTFSPIYEEELKSADLIMRMIWFQRSPRYEGKEKRISRYKFVGQEDLDFCKEIFGYVPDSLHAFVSKLQKSKIHLSSLPVPHDSMLHAIWVQTRRYLRQSRRALQPAPRQPPVGFVSKRRLMNEMGLHPTAIDYLMEVGLLQGVMKVPATSALTSSFLIPEDEFQGLLALYKGSMSIKEAADFALVRAGTIRILGYSQVVQTFRLGKCKYVFRIKATDLSEIVQRLLFQAQRYRGSFENLVSLEDALTELYQFDTALPKTLLNEIYAGRLQVWVFNRSALHLGECYLGLARFRDWCGAFMSVGARRVNQIPS